ncbi:MAG: 8-oxo-dGTP diphosphatase MutT [Alteromonadaceae bacterium]|nr:MAG: 8-oxo-dGTP diphosphatase MutT [Alteromonadaceae bacterium]
MSGERKTIHVAVAVIENTDGHICITKRPEGKHLAGYWEFPGGKVESGEAVPQALGRELQEELGISVLECEPFIMIKHSYAEMDVLLDVYMVTVFDGVARGAEGQELRWVSRSQLPKLSFPEANESIVEALISTSAA